MIKKYRQVISAIATIIIGGVILYGKFLENPIIFDDIPFFLADGSGKLPVSDYHFSLSVIRSLPYTTLALTKQYFGDGLVPYRLGNLILHLLNVIVIYFIYTLVLQKKIEPKSSNNLNTNQVALIIALVFVVHPVSTYAVGYLVQRTILMAALFGNIALYLYMLGEVRRKSIVVWASVPFYYLSVYSKEHAIMLLPVFIASTVLMSDDYVGSLKKNMMQFIIMLFIASLVIASKLNIIGSTYEPAATDLINIDLGWKAYPLSVINQSTLFFKYLWIWFFPNINHMSIDIKEKFETSLFSTNDIGLLLFILWGVLAAYILTRRGVKSLIGYSMIFPWLMYATELSTVRIQEPFVLYRSYLWFSGALLFVPVILANTNKKLILAICIPIFATLFLMSAERLVTLGNSILLWADAEKLVDGHDELIGTRRIYYNYGRELLLDGHLDESIQKLNHAIKLDYNYSIAHGALGAAYLEKKNWQKAVDEFGVAMLQDEQMVNHHKLRYLKGRAKAYENLGMLDKAALDYQEACVIDATICMQLIENTKQSLIVE